MKTINVEHPPKKYWLGRKREKNFRPVPINAQAWLDQYPGTTVAVIYRRPDGTTFPVATSTIGEFEWLPKPDATAVAGEGKLEIHLMRGNEMLGISATVKTTVDDSLADYDDSEIPETPSWVDEVVQDVTEQADRAEAAVSHYPKIVNGVWFVWDAEQSKFVSTGISAQGEDGVSPTVTVTEIEGGHRVTIADADGAHTFDVMDGEGGGSGAVQSVNGKTGAVTLTASDVNALPDSTVIPTVPAMATDPDMTDWDTGKIVDAAALKSGFTLVGNVLSRKANVSDIPTAVSELTNDSGYQTAQDVATVIAAIPAVRYDVAQSLTPAQQEHARGNIGVTETRSIPGKNRVNPAELEVGVFITASGVRSTNGNYAATGYIPVAPGEVIRGCYINTSGGGAQGNLGMRWIAAYDANKDVLKTLGTDTQCSTFTVPEGVSFLRISYHAATYGTTVMIEANPDGWSAYEPYGPVSHEYLEHTIRVAASQVDTENPEKEAATGIRYTFDLDANGFDGEESIEDLADYAITFRAPLPASFDGVTVARGYQIYQGGYVTVTDTTVGVYVGENSTEKLSVAHGLTLKDYISIKVEVGHDFKAKVTVGTNGGVFERSGIGWPVRVGTLSALPVGSTEIDGCELSYYCSAWNADTQLYGDSYFSVDSTERWTSYLYADGYKNVLLNAFSGRHAAQGLAAAKIVLAHSFPKRIVWFLGMNNGDNGKVNAGWKSATEELMELCEARGIELILATIPNIPTMDNTYKNAYVKASGLRYIDFAAAVGAENDTTWYDGMLSSDGVHPAAPGALALYRQAIADVPELIQKSDVPTKLSQLANDSGFQTAAQVQSAIAAIPDELPTVTASDNGKFLRVVSGAWAAETVSTWQGGSY